MSDTGTGAAHRAGSGAGRMIRAWQSLPSERRLAALASVGLFLTLFLPWYQETVIARTGASALQSATFTLTGWGAFSFVEALLLLVAGAVLFLLFRRAEGRSFPFPGGDGVMIMSAGCLASVLIVWRIFAQPGTSGHGQYATASGIEWGIVVALAVAVLLAYSGSRVRIAPQTDAPSAEEDDGLPFWGPVPPAPASPASPASPATAAARSDARRARMPRPVAAQGPQTRVSGAETRGSGPETRGSGPGTRGSGAGTRGSSGPETTVSEREPPTRVSRRKRAADPIGPPVVPEDPPTMRFAEPRTKSGTDEQLTMPLERDGKPET